MKYRWKIQGYNFVSGDYKDLVVISEKNPVQVAEQLLVDHGQDFVIESMELTHKVQEVRV